MPETNNAVRKKNVSAFQPKRSISTRLLTSMMDAPDDYSLVYIIAERRRPWAAVFSSHVVIKIYIRPCH